ncbi:tetratricopeptide repeat protein [Actinophytocola sp.]|uniref:tetratricopeptide repeat protein n=1 Tax=Actinophytocola sp. TaxID=1872138 RepID=UPI00389AB7A5
MTEATDGSTDSELVKAARLSHEGRPRAAIAMLESVLSVDPDNPVAWCRMSAAYLDIGEAREALDAAKRAMALGEPAWAHRLASLALVELGRYDEAVISAGEAVRRAPDDWRGLVALSEALAHEQPEQAVRAARAAVEKAPSEPRTHEVLGDAAMLAHDWMLAEHAYRDAVHLEPDNEAVAAKLDRVRHRPGDDPRRRRHPIRTRGVPPRFERAHRMAWYVAVRRASLWQTIATLLLLATSPPPRLAWLGMGILLFVVFLAWRGWMRLPEGGRAPLTVLYEKVPLAVVGGAVLGVSLVAFLAWTATLALATAMPSLLAVSAACALVALVVTWLGLRRMWKR